LAGRRGGVVRIHIANRDAKSRLVRVEADYPDDPVHRHRWTQQIIVDLK
jgi:hypothetical protein